MWNPLTQNRNEATVDNVVKPQYLKVLTIIRFRCFYVTQRKYENSQYYTKTLSGLLFFQVQRLVQF